MDENKIALFMKNLDLTREEAIDLILEDAKIDKMTSTKQIDSDLTPDQKKAVKKAKNATRAVDAYGKERKVQRKENPTKKGIVSELFEFLSENSKFEIETPEITNAERQISFKCGENWFELTLVQKRKKK